MRRIINTYRYGSSYTKRVLTYCIVAGTATIGLAACAFVFKLMLLFFGALIGGFTTLSLVQTFKISDGENTGTEAFTEKKHKKKERVRTKQSDEAAFENKADSENESEPVQATIEDIESYDKRKLRKTFRRYKVKRDHRMVMIDNCSRLGISQAAAYIWVAEGQFHILVIEKEPRHITLPLFRLQEVTYLKKQPANPDIDYAAFKGKGVMAELFKEYLPDYIHSTVMDDLTAYKNLYGLGPDIYFTNKSASNIFELLGIPFNVSDKVTESDKVNLYFKDTYKANILLRDNVIDANGYADRISDILNGMAHSSISYAGFKDTLNLMIKNKLITQEFAMYYMGVRDKISG